MEAQVPTTEQLERLATLAVLAWGDDPPIRYGYTRTRKGVNVYVKQRKRDGCSASLEGEDTKVVIEKLEMSLVGWAATTQGLSEDEIRNLVAEATAKA